ncbi:MAG: hypothetical protein GXY14_05120 [Spirochaetes bacterium]|nr:hypothetical protein [Spirochaetota bacterium]
MKSEHLSFDQLSDLFDNEVTDNERKTFTLHIQACSTCRREYESLCMCLSMLKGSKGGCGCIPDICQETIATYRAKIRKREYLKSVPAIAASVLIIAGIGFLHTGHFMDEKTLFSAQVSTQGDLERIIDSIRDSKGRIISITGEYVDGEIPRSDLAKLERVLNYFRIKHTIISDTQSPLFTERSSGFEEAGFRTNSIAGASMFGRGSEFLMSSQNRNKIHVRIFK